MSTRGVSRGIPRHLRASEGHGWAVAPSEARGPSALTRFGKTSQCAVPNEVEDALLMLGRTKKEAWQDGVGGSFLKSPLPLLTKFKFLLCNLFNESNF